MRTLPSLIVQSLLILTLFFSVPVAAHVHGSALLQLAISEDSNSAEVTSELRASGADMVGFEHPAATVDESRLVEDTRASLDRSDWIRWPASSGCVLLESTTTVSDHEIEPDAGHDEANLNHDDDQAHGDWINRSHWRCRSIPTRLETRLSGLSSTLRSLDVQYITPQGQGSAQLTHLDSLLSLDPGN